MSFEGQRPDERIILNLRKHTSFWFKPLLFMVVLAFLPIFTFIYFKFSWVFSYAFFLWLIASGFYMVKSWYCFVNSWYILTNKRLIVQNQKGIFHKTLQESSLDKIVDVAHEVKGFWPSMFDFGTIIVQIYPPSGHKIILEMIEEPKKIQEQILTLVQPHHDMDKHKENPRKMEDIKKNERDFWD